MIRLTRRSAFALAIATYGGNPVWLKLVADTIGDLFGGRVGEFLTDDGLFLREDLTAVLDPFGADQKSKKSRSRLWQTDAMEWSVSVDNDLTDNHYRTQRC